MEEELKNYLRDQFAKTATSTLEPTELKAYNILPGELWKLTLEYSDGPIIPISDLGKVPELDYLIRKHCSRWYNYREIEKGLDHPLKSSESHILTNVYWPIEKCRNKALTDSGHVTVCSKPSGYYALTASHADRAREVQTLTIDASAYDGQHPDIMELRHYFYNIPVEICPNYIRRIELEDEFTEDSLDHTLNFISQCTLLKELRTFIYIDVDIVHEKFISLNRILSSISVESMDLVDVTNPFGFSIPVEEKKQELPLFSDTMRLKEIEELHIGIPEERDRDQCDIFEIPIIRRVKRLYIAGDTWIDCSSKTLQLPLEIRSLTLSHHYMPRLWKPSVWKNLKFLCCAREDVSPIFERDIEKMRTTKETWEKSGLKVLIVEDCDTQLTPTMITFMASAARDIVILGGQFASPQGLKDFHEYVCANIGKPVSIITVHSWDGEFYNITNYEDFIGGRKVYMLFASNEKNEVKESLTHMLEIAKYDDHTWLKCKLSEYLRHIRYSI